jgi:hypothetical protein
VADLERELRELGRSLELPPTPDLVSGVRGRLGVSSERRTLLARRTFVLAFAALAVAVGAVLAVPEARTAILEWLGLRGVTIERVETVPTATVGLQEVEGLALGAPVSLAEARERVGHELVVPRDPTLGPPDGVHLDPEGRVSLVYRDDAGRVDALLTQFRAELRGDFVRKAVGPGTTVEPVSVAGGRGWWIEGEPHEIVLVREEEPVFETLRLATNTLLWERRGVTLRLEADLTREEAIRIGDSASRL